MKRTVALLLSAVMLLLPLSALAAPDTSGAAADFRTDLFRDGSIRRSGADSPIEVFGDPGLSILSATDTLAVVQYDLSVDGQPMDAAYLYAHMECVEDPGAVPFLWPTDWYSYGNPAEIPLLPPGTRVGTNMGVFYANAAGEYVCGAVIVVKGDVIGTGTINIAQLPAFARMLNTPGDYQPAQLLAADWNNSEKLEITDLVAEATLLRIATAPPVTAGDFVISSAYHAASLQQYGNNLLTAMRDRDSWCMYFHARDGVPLADIITTSRGIQLGSTFSQVRQAYGFGWTEACDLDGDADLLWFEDEDPAVWQMLQREAATVSNYYSANDEYIIRFVFNAQERVILIEFIDVSQLRSGRSVQGKTAPEDII